MAAPKRFAQYLNDTKDNGQLTGTTLIGAAPTGSNVGFSFDVDALLTYSRVESTRDASAGDLTLADQGKIINMNATLTVSGAVTFYDGFIFKIRRPYGVGAIPKIVPSGAQQIDGKDEFYVQEGWSGTLVFLSGNWVIIAAYTPITTIESIGNSLNLTDSIGLGTRIEVNSGVLATVSIQDFEAPLGSWFEIEQRGPGQCRIVAGVDVRVNSMGDPLTPRQFAVLRCMKTAVGEWTVSGNDTETFVSFGNNWTFSGSGGTPAAIEYNVQRTGDQVVIKPLNTGGEIGTTGLSGFVQITNSELLPAQFRPAAKVYQPFWVRNNGTGVLSVVTVDTDGTITVCGTANEGGFGTSAGFGPQPITYVL